MSPSIGSVNFIPTVQALKQEHAMDHEPSFLRRLFSLEGRTALITGASGGIGSALALGLAETGVTVGLHGTRLDQLEELHAQVAARGGRATILPADLGDIAACRRLIAGAHTALGRLDILINCAGINRRKPAAAVTEEDFEAIVAVNLRSLFFLCQAVQPIMRAQGGGKIINIGSVTSVDGLGEVSVYGATKAAVAQLTKTLAVEWAKDNIQVNCLAPGFIVTPLTETALWGDAWRRQWLLDRIPARRPGMPEELVGAVLLLASAASSYLTGHTLVVDGGYLAGGSWLRDDA
jgi:2-deoxy-D-gluconate 3-dehydrogenase